MAKKKKSNAGRPKLPQNEKRLLFQGKFKPFVIDEIEKRAEKTHQSGSYIVESILIEKFKL